MKYLITNLKLWLNKNDKLGEILTLSDNSFWHIDVQGKLKTSLWLVVDEIKVSQKDMIYYLTNVKKKETVPAQFIEPK